MTRLESTGSKTSDNLRNQSDSHLFLQGFKSTNTQKVIWQLSWWKKTKGAFPCIECPLNFALSHKLENRYYHLIATGDITSLFNLTVVKHCCKKLKQTTMLIIIVKCQTFTKLIKTRSDGHDCFQFLTVNKVDMKTIEINWSSDDSGLHRQDLITSN
jgi:hypothetical protein